VTAVTVNVFGFDVLVRAPKNLASASRVQIESLPYDEILKRYDRPTTFFYLDPPYYGRKLYNYNFEPEDFAKLAKHLKALQGKFLLSLNDVPEVRALFDSFTIREIDLHYTAQKCGGRRYPELIITNY
jgi:DNA adenine methylase